MVDKKLDCKERCFAPHQNEIYICHRVPRLLYPRVQFGKLGVKYQTDNLGGHVSRPSYGIKYHILLRTP